MSLVDNGNGTASLIGTPTLDDAGNSTVTFKASDGNLAWTETMTMRVVYDAVTLSSSGVLRVAGTTGDDVVRVWQPRGSGQPIRVIIGDTTKNYAASAITAIQIFGREGNDLLQATCQDVAAYIQAGDGDDTIVGGDLGDSITGAAGDDLIYGMGGDDWIDGNGGRDTIYCGDGNDRAYGGNGRDVIDGGLGNDVLYGEVGPDLFITNDRARDWIFGGEPDINYVQTDGIKDILYDAAAIAV
ncbi:MAG: calcium-binding protein [Tepidisphaeraceae bacterium]